MNTELINYSNILEGSGLGDIAHLIHGGVLVIAAVLFMICVLVVAYKVWKGEY